MAFNPNIRFLASGTRNGLVALWGATNNELIGSFEDHDCNQALLDQDWSPDGEARAAGSTSGLIYMWELDEDQPNEPIQALQRHLNWVSGLSWSPDVQSLASTAVDNLVVLWDLDSGSSTIYPGLLDPVCDVPFSPDGMMLASASRDKLVNVWSTLAGDSTCFLAG